MFVRRFRAEARRTEDEKLPTYPLRPDNEISTIFQQ